MRLLRQYLKSPTLTLAQATTFLRLVFVLVFMAQLLVAMLSGIALRLAVPGAQAGNPLLGWVLVAISLPHLPLVLFLSSRGVKAFDRGASLSATLLAGVMLSTPAWFLSLALITGQQLLQLGLLLGILLLQYAIGLFLSSRFARLVIPSTPASSASPEPGTGVDQQ